MGLPIKLLKQTDRKLPIWSPSEYGCNAELLHGGKVSEDIHDAWQMYIRYKKSDSV